jgi:hypothetical protein
MAFSFSKRVGDTASGGWPFPPESYLTDGTHLYRVVSPLAGLPHTTAELEDCVTFETRLCGLQDFQRLGLWLVKRAPDQPAESEDPLLSEVPLTASKA